MGTNQSTKFIGLDVHKNSISLAIASNGDDGEVRLYGTIIAQKKISYLLN